MVVIMNYVVNLFYQRLLHMHTAVDTFKLQNVSLKPFSTKLRIMSKFFESTVPKQSAFDIYTLKCRCRTTEPFRSFRAAAQDLIIYKKVGKTDGRTKETG